MGDPRKRRKMFDRPKKPFEKERIEKEREMKQTYGLKNKREIYRAQTAIRKKRATAKRLLALDLERRLKREKELLESLKRLGILTGKPSLEDALTLTEETLLERRLQTLVWRKGLANTAVQARQFITHGHVAVDGKKVDKPGYLVTVEEEGSIAYYGKPMEIKPKKKEEKKEKVAGEKKNELKEQFEEAKGDMGKKEAKEEKKELKAEVKEEEPEAPEAAKKEEKAPAEEAVKEPKEAPKEEKAAGAAKEGEK